MCNRVMDLAAKDGSCQEAALCVVRKVLERATDNSQAFPCLLETLAKLLNHPKRPIRKDSYACIAAVANGGNEQLQAVFDETGLLSNIVGALGLASVDDKSAAMYVVSEIISKASPDQVVWLTKIGLITPLVHLLKEVPKELSVAALVALDTMLQRADVMKGDAGGNPVAMQLAEIDGIEALVMEVSSNGADEERAARIFNALGGSRNGKDMVEVVIVRNPVEESS